MEKKLSPKLAELCQWHYIKEVNKKLDNGDSINSVATFISARGFKISVPMVYEYAKLRKKALVDGVNVEHMISSVSKPVLDKNDPDTQEASNKLRSEIDALDVVIQSGYKTLVNYRDQPINPRIMMDAIRLKYQLTDGNHGFLTNSGMEELRQIEQQKYQLIIDHLISYIPEQYRQEAVDAIDSIEDNYYQTTPYYAEYLKAKGLSETEIKQHMEKLAELQKSDTEEPTTTE